MLITADIEVFSGPGCSQCEAAKAMLNAAGLPFTEFGVDDPKHLADFQRRLPRIRAIPQIFVDGEHIGSTEDLVVRKSVGRPPFG